MSSQTRKPEAEDIEQDALNLAERSDLSPNQAKELIRHYGKDSAELEKAARNVKAES